MTSSYLGGSSICSSSGGGGDVSVMMLVVAATTFSGDGVSVGVVFLVMVVFKWLEW